MCTRAINLTKPLGKDLSIFKGLFTNNVRLKVVFKYFAESDMFTAYSYFTHPLEGDTFCLRFQFY